MGEAGALVAVALREVAAQRVALAAGRTAKAGLSPLADALFTNAQAHLAADAKLLDDLARLLTP
ncbi:hypothetical protein [Nonomuraea gerenzanensis]|uniref:Uncharacterized protein n=1 Tax=Nonomuraea gerenzanensis TaxID=93944 RepID=A0A1M4DYX2_9ACTN|nr:hypothetical protein [Nonomuraea gerenzanensis]UBU14050.1 hypothetical protein LCN96_03185 [Nonomuraea gerenzanensis]SBO91740.1 hypothetical protein BN4615_P1254 [Nonomuraea gerenzanensis]